MMNPKLKADICILASVCCIFIFYRGFSQFVIRPLDKIDSNGDKAFESWLQEQNDLKENINRVCSKYGGSLRMSVSKNMFMHDPRDNLLYCRNAKVGSTSWLKNFLYLSDDEDLINRTLTRSQDLLHFIVPVIYELRPSLR